MFTFWSQDEGTKCVATISVDFSRFFNVFHVLQCQGAGQGHFICQCGSARLGESSVASPGQAFPVVVMLFLVP